MLEGIVGLGTGHRVIALSHDVQLETVVGKPRPSLSTEGHSDVAIDINRIEQMGLDLNPHLRHLRDVVAFASEADGVVLLLIVGLSLFISVFFIGIRIFRG